MTIDDIPILYINRSGGSAPPTIASLTLLSLISGAFLGNRRFLFFLPSSALFGWRSSTRLLYVYCTFYFTWNLGCFVFLVWSYMTGLGIFINHLSIYLPSEISKHLTSVFSSFCYAFEIVCGLACFIFPSIIQVLSISNWLCDRLFMAVLAFVRARLTFHSFVFSLCPGSIPPGQLPLFPLVS